MTNWMECIKHILYITYMYYFSPLYSILKYVALCMYLSVQSDFLFAFPARAPFYTHQYFNLHRLTIMENSFSLTELFEM